MKNKICGNFLFDTGWSGITLDSMFCDINSLNYKTIDIEGRGVGNSTMTFKLIADTIYFEFSNKEFGFSSTTTMVDLKGMLDKKVDGITGIQTFAQKPYLIDYISQKIIFIDSVKGYKSINAHFEDNRIYLPLSITLKNGKMIQGKFLLDTGSTRTFFNSHVYNTDGIYNSNNKKKVFTKGGVGGNSNGYFLPVSAVELGEFKLKNLITTVSTDTLGMLANSHYMGIIGNDVLDDFHIIFDHQKEKVWVKPNKNFNKNERKLYRGVSFYDAGKKWYVAGIVEDTEAYRKGIRMDDEILEVNNIPVENIDLDHFVDKLRANDVLNLKVKQGDEEKEIKFKLNVFIKS
ncbi:PDZ domain-containing protein [Flavobacterium sp. C4GT6]|uniref:PDZ domain-containing protein n=1 Tax=Flavobacterium sp. C4GT6 TaxID=3103818 RepID=UPI002ED12378